MRHSPVGMTGPEAKVEDPENFLSQKLSVFYFLYLISFKNISYILTVTVYTFSNSFISLAFKYFHFSVAQSPSKFLESLQGNLQT